MFERFHQDARAAVVQARDEAIRAGQREIGTEHLLIALLDGPGLAADALTAAGADAADLRARIPHGEAGQQEPLDGDALASIGIDLDTVRRASDAAFGAGSLDRARRRSSLPCARPSGLITATSHRGTCSSDSSTRRPALPSPR
jgi:hypothetical protein